VHANLSTALLFVPFFHSPSPVRTDMRGGASQRYNPYHTTTPFSEGCNRVNDLPSSTHEKTKQHAQLGNLLTLYRIRLCISKLSVTNG